MCKYVCTCACHDICMCTYVRTCRITYMYIFETIFATILLQTYLDRIKWSDTTFHQSKGLERKIVIVYGFEDSYFRFYKRDCDPLVCPNELYVACTRGSQHLVLVHQYTNGYLPFLNRKQLLICCNVEGDIGIKSNKPPPSKQLDVCDLIRHLSVDVIDYCFSRLQIINIKKSEKKISIPDKSLQKDNLYESLSDITGIALPMYFAYKLRPENNELKTMISQCKDETVELIKEKEEENRKIISIYRKKLPNMMREI